ncbi:hypothetical protein [Pseudomonas sp. BGI-2]|uniref:hypothetical protein n=1 Tax=Pseudomonas sp. BGI-2 TaxID=2528211 RepID=UPI001033AEF4|nr:hypothetical protein [Pseudomonas sp. BGI-2]TBN35515.1 hypothetical protein EYC95_25925 [Pseudomonas sp. BGI-2]
MELTRYLYNGPPSAATLRVGESRELLDVQLSPGMPAELPPEHEYTLVLLELQHLELLPAETKRAAKTTPAPPKVEKE